MNFRSWEYAKKEAAPTRATGGTGRRPGNQGLFNRDLQVILSFAGAALLAGVVYLFVKSQGG
ncbi:MAG: hypothetical protein Q7Q71_12920 [Verrucomicrobiota bacterium JB023]|nr:hypothetical protein [Verrucomicrobiota bacterium JB023]